MVVSVAVPCSKHLRADELVLWGSGARGLCAAVLRALRRVLGVAAEIALWGAGGFPNLPSDLLLNTLGFGVATSPLQLFACSSGYECCIFGTSACWKEIILWGAK